MRFVTLEEAREATGPKLVVAASLPSPWAPPDLFGSLPPVLRAHRDRIYEKHLELPVRLS